MRAGIAESVVRSAWFWACWTLVAAAPISAKDVLGVPFEEHIALADHLPLLVLNGTAVRRKAQYTTYVAGLYLSVRKAATEQVLRDPGPKRLELHMQSELVEPEALVSAWNQGFTLNLSREELRQLRPPIEQFNRLWVSPLLHGDRVLLDYLPGEGTRVSVNGAVLGLVAGADFNRALLKVFIGRHPVARNVKEGLLGH